MPDIEKVRTFLRDLQSKMLDDHMSYDDRVHAYNYLAVTLTLLTNMEAELERLTPRPMTRDRVAEVLNEHEYLGCSTWFASKMFLGFYPDVHRDRGRNDLTEFEAYAGAEKLLREKEAARG